MKLLIYSQTLTVAKFGTGWIIYFIPRFFLACDYVSMLGLKLNHISKRSSVTILGLVKLGQHWLAQWVVDCLSAIPYIIKCRFIISCYSQNKFHGNLKQDEVYKGQPFWSCLNVIVLKVTHMKNIQTSRDQSKLEGDCLIDKADFIFMGSGVRLRSWIKSVDRFQMILP